MKALDFSTFATFYAEHGTTFMFTNNKYTTFEVYPNDKRIISMILI